MKRTTLRAGDRLELGDGHSVLIEQISGSRVKVLAESTEHITVKSRSVDGHTDDDEEPRDPAGSV